MATTTDQVPTASEKQYNIKLRRAIFNHLEQGKDAKFLRYSYAKAGFDTKEIDKHLADYQSIVSGTPTQDTEEFDKSSLGTGELAKKYQALQETISEIGTYRDLVDKYTTKLGGGIQLTGKESAELRTAKSSLLFTIAVAEGTGALQAPDREVVEQMIPDPTSLTGAGSILMRGGKEGVLTSLDRANDIFNNKISLITGKVAQGGNQQAMPTVTQEDQYNPSSFKAAVEQAKSLPDDPNAQGFLKDVYSNKYDFNTGRPVGMQPTQMTQTGLSPLGTEPGKSPLLADDGEIKTSGFFDNMQGNLERRADNVSGIIASDQSTTSKVFQIFGQGVAWGINDLIGEALSSTLSAITPDAIEEPAKEKLGIFAANLIQSAPVEALSSQYRAMKEANPQLAGNIEAATNIAFAALNLAPAGKIVEGTAKLGAKVAGKTTSNIGKAVSGTTRFATGQSTGLAGETISAIIRNPDDFARGAQTVDRLSLAGKVGSALDDRIANLSEMGQEYQAIRESGAVAAVKPTFLEDTLKKFKLEIVKGKITPTTSSVTRNPSDIRALQEVFDNWNGKTSLTSDEYLNFRSDLAELAKYDRISGKTNASENVAKSLRNELNAYRDQIPGLSELDAQYAPEIKELSRIRKELLNPDGTLKDGALNKIANAGGKGKDLFLSRLESIAPGIGEDLNILKALEDIQAASGIKVGTYTRAGIIGGSYLTGNLPGAIAAYIATSPSVVVPILRMYGKVRNTIVDPIIDALKNGVKLSSDQLNVLDDAIKSASGVMNNRASTMLSGAAQSLQGKGGLSIKDVSQKGVPKKGSPAVGQTADPLLQEEGNLAEAKQYLREAKGLSAEDIMKTHPDINLKRDVPITDIHGVKKTILAGDALTPYELKGNKILLQDGETYIVSKNQFQNIKGNAVSGEAKPFAPELKGTEESVRGASKWDGDELYDNGNRLADVYEGEKGKWHYRTDLVEESPAFKTRKEAMENAEADALGIYSGNETKYSQYQLPGGENYKEVLIKAPASSRKVVANTPEEASRLLGEQMENDNQFFNVTAEDAGAMVGKEIDTRPAFRSSHWDEPNVISHLRLNERTYKGKKVTFMEELQSDWAREARAGKTTATAPQLKNWQELSVKRGLQEAVANDSQYFAWTTGEQQAARYNLAKEVKSIEWTPPFEGEKTVRIKPVDGSEMQFHVDKNGIVKVKAGDYGAGTSKFEGKPLSESLGKGLTEKILAEPKGNLSGEGLNIGGEWAKNLYDKQVKSIVEDVTGGKVETLDMGLAVEGKQSQTRWTIPRRLENGLENPVSMLNPSDVKIGLKIHGVNGDYIITDVLGDGKFKAMPKEKYLRYENSPSGFPERYKNTFDISTKKSAGQQAIKITPEIRARVLGEAPILKKASGLTPFIKTNQSKGGGKKGFTESQVRDATNIYKKATPLVKPFDELIGKMSKELGLEQLTPGNLSTKLKSVEGILKKKYQTGDKYVNDSVRDTVFTVEENVPKIIKWLESKGAKSTSQYDDNGDLIREGLKNRFTSGKPGYKDANFQFTLPGSDVVHELQIMGKNMFKAKEQFGHFVYDLGDKDLKVLKEKNLLTPEAKDAINKLQELSVDIYEKAYQSDKVGKKITSVKEIISPVTETVLNTSIRHLKQYRLGSVEGLQRLYDSL